MNKTLAYVLIALAVVGAAYFVFKDSLMKKDASTVTPVTDVTPTGTATTPTPGTTTKDTTMEAKTQVIQLSAQNNSGETGTVTLTEQGSGKTKVDISLTGAPQGTPQPAHIHVGACPNPGAVKYPLTNVVNGKSTTVLDTTLAKLESELPLAINIHKSATEVSVYVACGDVTF